MHTEAEAELHNGKSEKRKDFFCSTYLSDRMKMRWRVILLILSVYVIMGYFSLPFNTVPTGHIECYRVTIEIRDNVLLTTLWLFHCLPNSAKAGCNWAEMVQSGASGRIVGLANWVDFDFGSSTVWPILFGQMEPPCIKVVQFA